MKNIENYEKMDLIERFNLFKEKGILNKTGERLVYDLIREKYINLKNGNARILKDKETAKKIAYRNFRGTKETTVLREAPLYNYVFNPRRDDLEYEENGDMYLNSFNVSKTMLSVVRKIKNRIELEDIEKNLDRFPAFKILLENIFVDARSREWYLNRLSLIINERVKVPTAAVIFGEQGSGKGTLVEFLLKPIFGSEYTYVATNKALQRDFNANFENKLYVVFNELKTDLKGNISDEVKALVSDSDLEINAKGINQYVVENTFNCDFFSNHSKALRIEASNRRFSVFQTGPNILNKIAESPFSREEYFAKLEAEKEEFILFIASLNYDKDMAYKVLETEELEAVIESTNTRLDRLITSIKRADYKYLEGKILEIVEMRKEMKESYPADYLVSLEKIRENMKKGIIEKKYLPFLYKMLVNEQETSAIKIGKIMSEVGPEKKGNGKTYRKLQAIYVPVDKEEDISKAVEAKKDELAMLNDEEFITRAYTDPNFNPDDWDIEGVVGGEK